MRTKQSVFCNSAALVVGATSAIAQAISRELANRGARLFLAGRSRERLAVIAADLAVRSGREVGSFCLDLNEFDRHREMLDAARDAMGEVNAVVIAHGTLPDQKQCEASAEKTVAEFTTNALSTIALLTVVANEFEAAGKGLIVVLSSVAGDRGRQSNYLYGAAKGAVTIFLQGLRNRLARTGVRVVTVKPGFVDTPMTAQFKKNFLWASPESVARDIVRHIERGKEVIYVPRFWRYVMLLIRAIPERWFKRLKL
jgi:decaprenylphospho-beta-D-erythro-pentofuranosid-2-ulose 2-reductase